jgi:preprotein translocase subunit SecA
MGALERFLILQIIDERWREHLYDMDYLREGIHLRGFAQIDPLVAYKNEAFELFGDLMNSVWVDFTRMIFNVQVSVDGQGGEGPGGTSSPAFAASGNSTRAGRVSYSGGSSAMGAGALAAAAAAAGPNGAAYEGEGEPAEALPVVEQRVIDSEHELGRNDPCWCGSGKKFKRCHGA